MHILASYMLTSTFVAARNAPFAATPPLMFFVSRFKASTIGSALLSAFATISASSMSVDIYAPTIESICFALVMKHHDKVNINPI